MARTRHRGSGTMGWFSFRSTRRNEQRRVQKRRGHGHRRSPEGRRLNRFEQLEDRRMLAVLTVNTNLDTTASDTVLTLREALGVVNTGSTAGLSAAELAQVNTTSALGTNDTNQF